MGSVESDFLKIRGKKVIKRKIGLKRSKKLIKHMIGLKRLRRTNSNLF